jgi:hypothetical protein
MVGWLPLGTPFVLQSSMHAEVPCQALWDKIIYINTWIIFTFMKYRAGKEDRFYSYLGGVLHIILIVTCMEMILFGIGINYKP